MGQQLYHGYFAHLRIKIQNMNFFESFIFLLTLLLLVFWVWTQENKLGIWTLPFLFYFTYFLHWVG